MEDADYPQGFNKITHEQDTSDDALSWLHTLFLPIAFSVTCVLGLIGNVLVILVFVFYEKIKTLTDSFFVILAIADILFLLTFPFLAYESAHAWDFGDALCKVIRGTYRVNFFTSMLTLTCITFDRFISITKVTKAAKYHVSKHKCRYGMCAVLWSLALLLALPQFIYSKSHHQEQCFEEYNPPIMEIVVVSLQMTVGFLLPLASMIICYSFILQTLVNARGVQKKKSMKIIVAIVVVFIATQLPYNALVLALALNKELASNTVFKTTSIVMEVIAYVHACLNPVLYFFVGTKFRKHFWRMLKVLGVNWRQDETTDHLRTTDGDSRNVSASTNICATSV
ncbi:C-X-C chemokine receptor type 6-like [Anomaloglossus baeobatrachus]|uniref:C-X-C chemokine receptor type 6-like n=1 Tax=Anomaloglossus baeobatrachus TaxID=238106 RepID=UPI003F4F869D